jgi:large subunit ribosomal protein L25
MKAVSISGSPRENVGKKDAKTLRRQERVPCVFYGGEEQIHFHVKELDINRCVFSPEVFIFDLDLGSKGQRKAVIQDMQFHPVTDKLLHVDFLEVDGKKELKITLPVRTTGASIGVRNGGRMSFPNRTINVQGIPTELPDSIEINIDSIRIGQSIRVRDLKIPGLKILANKDMVLYGVRMSRGAAEVEEVAAESEEGAEGAEAAEGDKPEAEEKK